GRRLRDCYRGTAKDQLNQGEQGDESTFGLFDLGKHCCSPPYAPGRFQAKLRASIARTASRHTPDARMGRTCWWYDGWRTTFLAPTIRNESKNAIAKRQMSKRVAWNLTNVVCNF